MAFIKTPADIFAQGNDLVLRGDFNGAHAKYEDSAQRFSKQGDDFNSRLARGYAAVTAIPGNQLNSDLYREAATLLNDLGETPIRLGPQEVTARRLSQELELSAEDIETSRSQPATPSQHEEKAKRQQALALRYRTQMSGQILVLPEIFNRQTIHGDSKALVLMAEAEQSLG